MLGQLLDERMKETLMIAGGALIAASLAVAYSFLI